MILYRNIIVTIVFLILVTFLNKKELFVSHTAADKSYKEQYYSYDDFEILFSF